MSRPTASDREYPRLARSYRTSYRTKRTLWTLVANSGHRGRPRSSEHGPEHRRHRNAGWRSGCYTKLLSSASSCHHCPSARLSAVERADAAVWNRGPDAAGGPADRVEHEVVDEAAGRGRAAALASPAGRGDRACELPGAPGAGVIGDFDDDEAGPVRGRFQRCPWPDTLAWRASRLCGLSPWVPWNRRQTPRAHQGCDEDLEPLLVVLIRRRPAQRAACNLPSLPLGMGSASSA